jgi:hypothetical protein
MKRSLLTVAAMAVFGLAACGDADNDAYIEPVDELSPPPAPAPAPAQPMDTMMPMDTTLMGDTLGTTTTGM